MASVLRFLELPSAPDVSFWARLAELKLNEYKLSEAPIPAVGHYRANVHDGLASPLTLTAASFDLATEYDVSPTPPPPPPSPPFPCFALVANG